MVKLQAMKTFLNILVLCLLWCTNTYALSYEVAEQEWRDKGGYEGDLNANIILDSNKFYIVIRNVSAKTKIYHESLQKNKPAAVFSFEAKRHCQKNEIYNLEFSPTIFNDHTVYYYCTSNFDTHDEFKNVSLSEIQLKDLKYLLRTVVSNKQDDIFNKNKKILKQFPKAQQVAERIKFQRTKYNDANFIFEVKQRSKKKETESDLKDKITEIKSSRNICKSIGFKKDSTPYSECVLTLFTQQLDIRQDKAGRDLSKQYFKLKN